MVTSLAVFLEMSPLPLVGSARMEVSVQFQGSAPLPSVPIGINVLFKAISQLSLHGSQDRWGKGGRFTILRLPMPTSNGCQYRCIVKASQPHLLVSADMGKGERMMPVLGRNTASAPLTLQVEVWGLHLNFSTPTIFIRAKVGTKLYLLPLSCPSLILLFYSCQCAHFQMFQHVDLSSVFVWWGEDLLLSYSCLTCKFKRRNKGINSLCHKADIFMWLFHYKNMSLLPLEIRVLIMQVFSVLIFPILSPAIVEIGQITILPRRS